MFNRCSGVLMHISSLNGNYGIGTFGKEAYSFVDFLSECGFGIWQILPLSPVDSYGSPYTSVSAFAGNPLFIDPVLLYNDGLISQELLNKSIETNIYSVDYGKVTDINSIILREAFSNADENLLSRVKAYCDNNSYWVNDYSRFMALKSANLNRPWWQWNIDAPNENDVLFHSFVQYVFDLQWRRLKDYANSKGVRIIGDMPFYISRDSADFYYNINLFDSDKYGNLKNVAGVPPDYFSKTGQLWGNPLYDWKEMKNDGYSWWLKRLKRSFELYDILRIDHFRGFSAYYSIPADSEDATKGRWIDGPQTDFFNKVKSEFPYNDIIAEDLGVTDSKSIDLLKTTGFYGMRVFQFGFSGDKDNPHLPINYTKESVAYTGTHDNNTTLGWVWELDERTRMNVLNYLDFKGDWGMGGKDNRICKSVIESVWQSPADIAIAPIQDILGYGSDTRMNRPGIANGNWQFRITQEALNEIDKTFLAELNKKYER